MPETELQRIPRTTTRRQQASAVTAIGFLPVEERRQLFESFTNRHRSRTPDRNILMEAAITAEELKDLGNKMGLPD